MSTVKRISEIEQRIQCFMDYGGILPGAKSYYPADWDTNYFEVAGKMFGMLSVQGSLSAIITLKNLPEKNEELREVYPGTVIPEYYANKTHWNSIYLQRTAFSDEEICQLILDSYQLVVAKLPKKTQQALLSKG